MNTAYATSWRKLGMTVQLLGGEREREKKMRYGTQEPRNEASANKILGIGNKEFMSYWQ